jgi:hypothetical protein
MELLKLCRNKALTRSRRISYSPIACTIPAGAVDIATMACAHVTSMVKSALRPVAAMVAIDLALVGICFLSRNGWKHMKDSIHSSTIQGGSTELGAKHIMLICPMS